MSAHPSLSAPILALGAILAALGMGLGAFGAHALRDSLDAVRLAWWNTAVQWHMWHAVALVALAAAPIDGRALPALLIGVGTIVFAGSLYVLALSGLRWLGAVTPIGGLLLIAGWLLLAWRAVRAQA